MAVHLHRSSTLIHRTSTTILPFDPLSTTIQQVPTQLPLPSFTLPRPPSPEPLASDCPESPPILVPRQAILGEKRPLTTSTSVLYGISCTLLIQTSFPTYTMSSSLTPKHSTPRTDDQALSQPRLHLSSTAIPQSNHPTKKRTTIMSSTDSKIESAVPRGHPFPPCTMSTREIATYFPHHTTYPEIMFRYHRSYPLSPSEALNN